jgi:rubrerythrin
MEDDHLRVFQALQERLRDRDWAKGFDPEAEAVLFLRAMATGKVFDVRTDPSELIKMMSPRDTLAMAIGFEKDSIAYYTGVKAIVPEDLGRQEIEHIIAEEMRHAALLSRRLQELEG